MNLSCSTCLVCLQVDKTQLMNVLKEEPSFRDAHNFHDAKPALAGQPAIDKTSSAELKSGKGTA